MKKLLFFIIAILSTVMASHAQNPADTVLIVDGYRVRAVQQNDSLNLIGLEVFSPEMKNSENKSFYNFVEVALLSKVQGNKEDFSDKLVIRSGSLEDFKKITPEMVPVEGNFNSKIMSLAWDVDGNKVVITLPIGYDTAKRGTRSEIENGFIEMLKDSTLRTVKRQVAIDTLLLEAYKDSLFITPGGSYQHKKITRNTFYGVNTIDSVTTVLEPVWDVNFPAESLANLFILPSDNYGTHDITMRILKHEYGDVEEITIPLDRFLEACSLDGCEPYFGIEKIDGNELQAALLCPNAAEGYTHVLALRCNPTEVIENNGILTGRLSLYVPVNNIDDLFAPYVKKTEVEKIHYEKYTD